MSKTSVQVSRFGLEGLLSVVDVEPHHADERGGHVHPGTVLGVVEVLAVWQPTYPLLALRPRHVWIVAPGNHFGSSFFCSF